MLDFLTKKNKKTIDNTLLKESYNEYQSALSEERADAKFDAAIQNLRLQYKMGNIPKINRAEYEILQFCHNRNMIDFLKEEFTKHPIVLDENGGLVGRNPFEIERNKIPNELTSQNNQQGNCQTLPQNNDYEIL